MAEHTAVKGDIKRITFTVSDANGTLDLTGKTLTLTLKRNRDDAAAFITKATGGSGIVIASPQSGATKGQATATIDPADTTGLPDYSTTLFYKLELLDGSDPYTTEEGTLVVRPWN